MNTVFHIVALVAFVVLGLAYVRERAKLKSLREFINSKANARIIVDWPENFLKRLADACNFDLDSSQKKFGTPQKIKPYPWVKLHFESHIKSITIAHEPWQVRVSVAQCPRLLTDVEGELRQALGSDSALTVSLSEEVP